MRIHSMGNNTDGAAEADAEEVAKKEAANRQDQEPWAYGDPYTARGRQAIEMRYQLLPYLYTAFRQHVDTGVPVLRNLFFYDQQDPKCRTYGDQFFCGQDLLVAPVTKSQAKKMTVYLPKGDWVHYHTGKHYKGGKKYNVAIEATSIPVFARQGAIIPIAPVVQHTGEFTNVKKMQLNVYCGAAKGSGDWYWDAGEGYDYHEEGYRHRSYAYQQDKKKFVLKQRKEGSYSDKVKTLDLVLIGLTTKAKSILVDGKSVKLKHAQGSCRASVPVNFKKVELSLG
jgi:alpha-glucosidase